MACNSSEAVQALTERVVYLEQRLAAVEGFLNRAFNTQAPQGVQHTQPADRSETGMGAIVSADRSSFI